MRLGNNVPVGRPENPTAIGRAACPPQSHFLAGGSGRVAMSYGAICLGRFSNASGAISRSRFDLARSHFVVGDVATSSNQV
jgi:hypothetical protein